MTHCWLLKAKSHVSDPRSNFLGTNDIVKMADNKSEINPLLRRPLYGRRLYVERDLIADCVQFTTCRLNFSIA